MQLFLGCRYFQHTHIIETVTGISIKQIFKDHRYDFSVNHKGQIRANTIDTINKVMQCGSGELGSMMIICNGCKRYKNIQFTCKSRFCNSCSKASSDKRLTNLIKRWPQGLQYYHLIFTIPKELRDFFKRHRKALKVMPLVASNAVQYFFKKKYKCTPGIVNVIHTFGAKLNWNTHVHMVLSAGGVTRYNTFRTIGFIPYAGILASWKGFLLKELNNWIYKHLNGEKYKEEYNLLQSISNLKNRFDDKKSWFIHFSQKADSFQKVLSYIGRYLKRPVIAQSRIKEYDGENIMFEYVDKYDGEKKDIHCSAQEFIGSLIQHIPQKHFKMVSYAGIFCNCIKRKFLKIIEQFIGKQELQMKIAKSYRGRIMQYLGIDIAKCSCGGIFKKHSISVPGYKTIYFNSS